MIAAGRRVPGPKGRNSIAQGEALGTGARTIRKPQRGEIASLMVRNRDSGKQSLIEVDRFAENVQREIREFALTLAADESERAA